MGPRESMMGPFCSCAPPGGKCPVCQCVKTTLVEVAVSVGLGKVIASFRQRHHDLIAYRVMR